MQKPPYEFSRNVCSPDFHANKFLSNHRSGGYKFGYNLVAYRQTSAKLIW